MLNLGLGSSKFMLVSSGGGGEAASFLLDDYSGAAAAYSVRRLNSSYTGPCMRIREINGDTETDIGFDSNGNLDTAAIAAHCGSANGYVVTWYDQSGSGNNATQSTSTKQPQIYDGTAVITENGKPAIENEGLSRGDHFDLTNPLGNVSLYSVFCVLEDGIRNPSIGEGSMIFTDNQADWLWYGSATQIRLNTTGNTKTITTSWSANQRLDYHALNSGTASFGTNGSALDSVTGLTGSIPMNYLLGNYGAKGVYNYNGKCQEFIIWPSDQSSNRTDIETDINSEYLIYQPTDTPTSGLLATYSGAAAAYSVRQLADTAVIAMTVRRDSDDEEQNFGFDENGDLDTAGIASFCGSANGYVSQWWDQSTNGNHASQGTAADQPKVYDASSGLLTENGKPYINFQSSQMTTGVLPSGTDSVFGVYKRVSSGSIMFLAHEDGWFNGVGFSGQTGTAFNPDAFIDGASFTGTRDDFWTAAGSQILVTTIRSFGSADDYNMTYQNGNNWNNFMRQELIIYPDDQSSNRSGIETDINDYFSIFTP